MLCGAEEKKSVELRFLFFAKWQTIEDLAVG